MFLKLWRRGKGVARACQGIIVMEVTIPGVVKCGSGVVGVCNLVLPFFLQAFVL